MNETMTMPHAFTYFEMGLTTSWAIGDNTEEGHACVKGIIKSLVEQGVIRCPDVGCIVTDEEHPGESMEAVYLLNERDTNVVSAMFDPWFAAHLVEGHQERIAQARAGIIDADAGKAVLKEGR